MALSTWLFVIAVVFLIVAIVGGILLGLGRNGTFGFKAVTGETSDKKKLRLEKTWGIVTLISGGLLGTGLLIWGFVAKHKEGVKSDVN